MPIPMSRLLEELAVAPKLSVLEVDPDLGQGIAEGELEVARGRTLSRVISVDGPGWEPGGIVTEAGEGWLGLLVLEGLLLRCVTVGRRSACELFGAGDVIRPWDRDGEYEPLTITLRWLVPTPARLAVLDAEFATRAARWPTIASQLVGRAAQRARYLALMQAISHLPRVHARLLIVFWLLAERQGRVTPEGVRIVLPVTHEVLGMLVGASRPTVTTALQRLQRAGLLVRERADRWLLTNAAIDELSRPESKHLVDDEPPAP